MLVALGLVAFLMGASMNKAIIMGLFVAPFVVTTLLAVFGFAERGSALLAASLTAFAVVAICYGYFLYEAKVRLPREGGVSSDAFAILITSLPVVLPIVMTTSGYIAAKMIRRRRHLARPTTWHAVRTPST